MGRPLPAGRFRGPNDAGPAPSLEVVEETRGRVLLIERDGTAYVGRGYSIQRSRDGGASWERAARVPRPAWRAAAERSRLASRLVRQEIRGLAHLSDGTLVAACKSGVFHGPADGGALAPSALDGQGVPLQYPLRLGVGPGDVVAWGEYVSPRRLRPVRIFASRNRGASFEVVHTLAAGEVLHVHNVVWDPTAGHWWVLAGDHGHEPGIGRLAADFSRFEWLVKGEQRFRAVAVFDAGDRLLYATDTEMEANCVVSLDKRTGASERIFDLEGSCLYACRFGEVLAVTTTVEPSRVNHSRDATLWLSRDGERWHCAWRARKDRWHADYFQFGSLVLPSGQSGASRVWLSGQAVESLDGFTVAVDPVTSLRTRLATEGEGRMTAREPRFEFGANWARFLRILDDDRIEAAERSLQEMLAVETLDGVRLLDIGSGSGLFSLAARRLGASVHSFDYDPQSVACTAAVRERYFPGDHDWSVEQGSALDSAYLDRLGNFDVVYSWGVLHHTGALWDAVHNATRAVKPKGKLFIALYNDQGAKSWFWWWVKRTFVALPRPLRVPWTVMVMAPFELRMIVKSTLAGRPREYVENWRGYRSVRGMSRWRDMVDWVGGFPYEVARPASVGRFLEERGFREVRAKLTTDAGCSEYVYERVGHSAGTAVVRDAGAAPGVR